MIVGWLNVIVDGNGMLKYIFMEWDSFVRYMLFNLVFMNGILVLIVCLRIWWIWLDIRDCVFDNVLGCVRFVYNNVCFEFVEIFCDSNGMDNLF